MNAKSVIRLVSGLALAIIVATGCGGAAAPTSAPPVDDRGSGVLQPQIEAATEAAAAPGYGSSSTSGGSDGVNGNIAMPPAPTGAPLGEAGPAGKSGAGAPPVAGLASDASGAGGTGSTTGSSPEVVKPPSGFTPPDQQFQQALTAGDVDDNKDFAAYLQYRTDYMRFDGAPVHDMDISERHAIRVRTSDGLPVLGALVTVYDGQERVVSIMTTATGIAYFFPNAQGKSQAQSYNVTVEKGQASKAFTLTRKNQDDIWDVTLGVSPTQGPVKLDILFLLDSTGSMGDEIAQIKDNILSISAQITALPSHPDVHFGMVTYRDRGDQYITRVSDFTSDVQQFQSDLQRVQAAGGGDEPESLNEAMHQTISGQLHWRTDPDTVRLVFLVSDAPPHLDYPQDYDYAQEMVNAAAQGIKIEPIAASNTNNEAEYIFRQIAQYTGGRFIFLTYQDTPQSNGQPGTTHHVQEGSYTTQDLDALVVKLVKDELALLSAAQGQQ